MKLYDYELSGNCYKVRLLMSLLGLKYESQIVEFMPNREHNAPWFLSVNPLGQLPVLEDEGHVQADSHAILMYLARKFDSTRRWLPDDAVRLAAVVRWFGVAESMNSSLYAARLHETFELPVDLPWAQRRGRQLLQFMNDHLAVEELNNNPWLCPGAHPTVADIACFPYAVLAEEGGVSLQEFPSVRRWLDRVKQLPGFIVMAGVLPAAEQLQPCPAMAAVEHVCE